MTAGFLNCTFVFFLIVISRFAVENSGERERPRSTDGRGAASPLSLPCAGGGRVSLTARPPRTHSATVRRRGPPWARATGRAPTCGRHLGSPRAAPGGASSLSAPPALSGSRRHLLPASGSEPALALIPESADPAAVGAPCLAPGSSACAEGRLQALPQTCLVPGRENPRQSPLLVWGQQ